MKKIKLNKEVKKKKFVKSNKIEKVLKILNDTLKTNFKYNIKKNNLSEIALNSDSKWDSLSHVKLLSVIEKKFKIVINEKNINQFSNFENIYKFLDKKKLFENL
jgi:acyl carrier protein